MSTLITYHDIDHSMENLIRKGNKCCDFEKILNRIKQSGFLLCRGKSILGYVLVGLTNLFIIPPLFDNRMPGC
jgi:hypothetical protein